MSEEYNNINNQEPNFQNQEEQPVSGAVQQESEAVEETSFVMKESEQAAGENREEKQEPGAAPTAENPYYAYSYKREGQKEEKKEEKTPYSSYHFASQIPPEPKEKKTKEKRPMGMGKKFGLLVAAAAVFGIVAGSTFQAVNFLGDTLSPKETVQIGNTETTQGSTAKAVSTSTAAQGSVAEVAKNVMPSIVSITGISVQEIPNYFGFGTQQYEGQSSGSGIIVGQNETELLIATNNHVVKDTNSITVCFTNQDGTAASTSNLENTSTDSNDSSTDLGTGTAVEAQIKGTDSDNDLAVVAVKLSDIPEDVLSQIKVATLGDSDSLEIGEQVVAIGNALGYGQSVTSGYVSALNKQVSSENANSTFIQTDAAINPGNSGGALLNMKGELIGINSAKIASDEVEGMGFAIPISKAEPILDNLMSKKTRSVVEDEDKAAYLGITCQNVTSEASQMYSLPVGVFVASVVEDGPAADAGIKEGDIIRKIDGTSVETYDNLTNQLQYYEAGEEIEFVISRAENGEYKEQTITVKLGAKKDAQTSENNNRTGR